MLSERRSAGEWRRARRYLKAEVSRVVALLRSIKDPAAPAVGEWSVGDVAMHLSQAWLAVPGLARRDLAAIHAVVPELRDGPPQSLVHDIWGLGDLTRLGVSSDPERDPAVLADRIEDRAAEYLALAGDGSAADRRTWLVEGTEVGLATLTCHLLNETIVHGWDIATGDGRRWDISRAPAAMVFDGFLVPVLQTLGPRDMVNQELAVGLRATYELRLRGGSRHVFAFDDGALSVEAPSSRPVDCIITADPATLLLVVWGRQDQARAIVQRQLVVSGPKAWLGPRLRSLMRNP
ncbi:MAG: SCP2 sterol-binding domain-containing protein [Acidimicrobiales bacterium]